MFGSLHEGMDGACRGGGGGSRGLTIVRWVRGATPTRCSDSWTAHTVVVGAVTQRRERPDADWLHQRLTGPRGSFWSGHLATYKAQRRLTAATVGRPPRTLLERVPDDVRGPTLTDYSDG